MSFFQRIVMGARRELAKSAKVCVLPNEERIKLFKKQTGTSRPVECVWNVPDLKEAGPEKKEPSLKAPLRIFYGGSLSPERLPRVVVEEIVSLRGKVVLDIVGYETYSAQKYLDGLIKNGEKEGKTIIHYHGTLPERADLLRVADRCEAALCLMPMTGGDFNMRTMAGASNKPFDAMARGLAVVVSDLEEWNRIYLEETSGDKKPISDLGFRISDSGEGTRTSLRIPESGKGYGIAINPESRESIRGGLEWMLTNREKLWEMGKRGRLKIETNWNYESMFRQVAQHLENN